MFRNVVQARCFSFKRVYQVGTVGAVDEAHLSPKEIVKIIDSYVIGQPEAKREVAVALRERWRRLQLSDDKAEEITPKNMLMSGPSGCGKTEIIRRVSKLLKAPFVKCDASTFTRRGVVGANVSDMIVDLYDAGRDNSKKEFRKQIKDVAKAAALDILVQCIYEDVLEVPSATAAEGDKVQEPQPAGPVGAPMFSSDQMQAIQQALTEKINKGGPAPDAIIFSAEVDHGLRKRGVRKPSTVVPANTTTSASASASPSDTTELEELLGKTRAELLAMGEGPAKEFLREKLAELAQVTEEPYILSCNVMHQKLLVEPADNENVSLSTTEGKGNGVQFPQMLFGAMGQGGGGEDHPESGSIKEFLKWIEDKLMSLLTAHRFHPSRSPVKELVEKWGIVCIDEIDKVVGKKGGGGGQDRWMNTDVQQELLTLIEGTRVNIDAARDMKGGGGVMLKMAGEDVEQTVIDTSHILFVCAGAFTLSKPQDMLVELLGRLPVRVNIHSLTEDDLYKILTDTKYPMIAQQTDLFSTEGVELKWDDEAVRQIAKVAHTVNAETQNTGARVLASILRSVLSEYSYNADEYTGKTITVTKEHVEKTTKKMLPTKELNTYVL
eukprot:TRINITY_DN11115_c1_g1_i1.p1 TRINITY_DN11115_c1_g1~~TRINITY_DN11115_c1_g1_i1.p1  ORF type:complete len:608 (+),score=293.42 TRINITY_DN11115_c1_g1_i1:67-1890(+)